jgi:hypothetical protein
MGNVPRNAEVHAVDELDGAPSQIRLRLAPAVGFGLRAAVLAGLVLSAGAGVSATTGLTDDPARVISMVGTTCCPKDGNR